MEKYLPIGTVVVLKDAIKKLMIIGFCSIDVEDNSKIYDYVGCMYPEGMLSSDETALFNHDQIDKICHMGFVDQEEQDFKNKLNSVIKDIIP